MKDIIRGENDRPFPVEQNERHHVPSAFFHQLNNSAFFGHGREIGGDGETFGERNEGTVKFLPLCRPCICRVLCLIFLTECSFASFHPVPTLFFVENHQIRSGVEICVRKCRPCIQTCVYCVRIYSCLIACMNFHLDRYFTPGLQSGSIVTSSDFSAHGKWR